MKPAINDKLDPYSPIYQQLQPKIEIGKRIKLNVKSRKEKFRNIGLENEKLINKLHQILDDDKGKKEKIQRSINNSQYSTIGYNSYCQRKISESKELARQNQSISRRLISAKPAIGNIRQWQKHSEKIQQNAQRIMKYSPQKRVQKGQIYIYQPMFSNCREFIADRQLIAPVKPSPVDLDFNKTVCHIDESRLYKTNNFTLSRQRQKRSDSAQARPVQSAHTSKKQLFDDNNCYSTKQIILNNNYSTMVGSDKKLIDQQSFSYSTEDVDECIQKFYNLYNSRNSRSQQPAQKPQQPYLIHNNFTGNYPMNMESIEQSIKYLENKYLKNQ